MEDDDINVEMIWAGKDMACAWVVLFVFHGVVTASISDIFSPTGAAVHLGVWGRVWRTAFKHRGRSFAGNRG